MATELLYIDLFCGAGGTSTGVERARLDGRKCARVIACVNHDANAILSHAANHPHTRHFTEAIRGALLEIRELVEKEICVLDCYRDQLPEGSSYSTMRTSLTGVVRLIDDEIRRFTFVQLALF